MPGPKGCFRSCLIGCGALTAVAVVLGVVIAGIAMNGLKHGGRVTQDLVALADSTTVVAAAPDTSLAARAARLTTTHPGRVVLTFGEGEFHLLPAAPGEGLHARADYDTEVHRINKRFTINADSTWEYSLEFGQKMDGMQAAFRGLFGHKTSGRITVWLPPEVPIDLVVRAGRGGCEADLGGLWLRTGDLDFSQGGLELAFSSPLHEPMQSLRLHTRMGGVSTRRLGNASPRVLDIASAMGGADIDLRGLWRGDCDASASVRMGGMSLRVPADMRVEMLGEVPPKLNVSNPEVPGPVLRLRVEQKMGEVEIRR